MRRKTAIYPYMAVKQDLCISAKILACHFNQPAAATYRLLVCFETGGVSGSVCVGVCSLCTVYIVIFCFSQKITIMQTGGSATAAGQLSQTHLLII